MQANLDWFPISSQGEKGNRGWKKGGDSFTTCCSRAAREFRLVRENAFRERGVKGTFFLRNLTDFPHLCATKQKRGWGRWGRGSLRRFFKSPGMYNFEHRERSNVTEEEAPGKSHLFIFDSLKLCPIYSKRWCHILLLLTTKNLKERRSETTKGTEMG